MAAPKPVPHVTLTSDFGTRDPYVAALKGVVLSRCPQAQLHDLSHDIPPQDIAAAALYIAEAAPWFPENTVHVVVVDPGVGSERLPIIVRAGKQFLVGPDNGVFSLLLQRTTLEGARVINNPDWMLPTVSATFHGRDVFAAAAGLIARGEGMEHSGPALERIHQLQWAAPEKDGPQVAGAVVSIDRFGNVISNIHRNDLGGATVRAVACGGHRFEGRWRTYSDAPIGGSLFLFSSGGYLELAVRDGSAAETFGLGRGTAFVAELGA